MDVTSISPSSLRVRIKEIWHSSGASPEILEILNTISSEDKFWKVINNDVWLIYLCCLIEKNDVVQFNNILSRYIKFYKTKDIERFLPLAHYILTHTQYINLIPASSLNLIKKSDNVYKSLQKNEKSFFEIVRNKSVAIVGNSNCEIGLGKGKEIDAHDIVIRFNNYCTEGYEQDYGSKTSIWVRGSAGEDIKPRNPSNYQLIVWEADYNHFMVHFDNLNLLDEELSHFPSAISNFNEETHSKLRKKSGLKFPSTGAVAIWATYLAKKSLDNVDIYGFSFINNNYDNTDHYYGGSSRLNEDHDFENEIKFLHNFYYDHKRDRSDLRTEDVTIFISCHKDSEYVKNNIFKPIQVGTVLSDKKLNMLHDDVGENISFKNKSYCELTAQFWAWKNYSSKYIGFLHYSRYFNFTETIYPEVGYNNINIPYISNESIKKYGWTDDQIIDCIDGYDIITTFSANTKKVQNKKDVYENYCSAPYLYEKDLLTLIQIIDEKSPRFSKYARDYLLNQRAVFCNMYIMRNDLFNDYCNWLFFILDEFVKRTDMSLYSVESMRTPGHLSERMFGMYLLYLQNERKDLKIKQLQKVIFTKSRSSLFMEQPANHVQVVLSCNEKYLPYLGVTIQSIIDTASNNKHYDLYILHSGISAVSQEKVLKMKTNNICIAFMDITDSIKEVSFHSNIDYISVETFFRFIIPDIFPQSTKILYIDCDLIVLKDLAMLYETNIDGYILGAVRQINSYDKIKQIEEVLNIPCYEYINAGVLLINIKEFIKNDVQGKAYALINAGIEYPTGDQDLLNAICNKKIKYLDESWNCPGPIYESMKKNPQVHPSVYTQLFEQSCNSPGIVHYMTSFKPWDHPERIMSTYFWNCARHSPFYEEILFRKIQSLEEKIASTPNKSIKKESLLSKLQNLIKGRK